MAGIISNVTGDIQRLRDLKTAIEDVKKSLISINIKVNVDMKESLEAKLKSLTDQYVELGTKVALTEARINQSAQNIIKAARKITEAQDNMSKASINVAPTSGSSVSTPNAQALSAEKVEIAAQAKAYNELKEQIGDIIGARGQNIKRMIEEQNAIRLINAEIKQITKSQGEYSNVSTSQQKRLEQLNNSLLTHKTVLAEVRQNLSNNVKLDNAAATSMNELSQSLSRMRITYRELTEEERKSPFGKELLTSINRADAEIKGLDATIGNHARNVGNYKAKWDGLGMSIQQIGRELPSLAYGPKVFFSAISNNLPILTDEIKRAKAEFKALKAEGKDATPVWKQVATSLFSWNTALTVGITLLTLYGDKIVDWVAGLFDAKDALSEVTSYQQNLSKVMSDGAKSSAQERVELDVLYKATQNHTKSLKDRNAAADELQRKYPSYFGNLSNEAILAGDVASAYKNLTDNILMAAQARSAMKIIEENYNKIYQTQKAINADTNWVNRNREKTKGGTATETASSVMNSSAGAVTQTVTGLTQDAAEYNRRTEALKKNKEAVDLLEKSNEALAESIDIAALTDDTTGKYDKQQESAAAKQKKEQQKLSDELLSLRRQNQQEEINLMKDGSETKLKQIGLNYQKEIDAIKKQEKEWSEKQGGKLTQEQSVEISARYTNADNKKDKGITDTTKEQLKVEQQALNQYLEKYGTFQQQKLAIAQEYAEKIRKAQEENGINSAQVKLLQREQKEKSSAIDTAAIKANIDWVAVFGEFGGMFTDMIKPALEEAKKYAKTDQFKNSDHSSQKSLIDAINQMEKSLGGAGGVNFKKLGQEVQVYQNSLRELNVAKNEETEAIDKLKKAQEDYEKAIKNGTEQEKQAAMDALDNAQDNANAASSNVKTQTDIVNQNQQGLSDTATNLKANMDNVADGLSKLASGGIKNAYDGLIQAGKGMGGAMEKVADSLEDVPIIGWIVSIIDVFKDGLSNLVGGLLDAVFNAVGGIIGDVLSGDLFVTIGKSVASGVGNILNSISFGGFDSLFGIGGNAKETAEKTDSLTASNDALKTSIDGLKDEIAGTNGAKSIQAYSEAVEAQGRYEENMRQILDAQMGYSSAHHSNAYYWDLDKNSLSQVNKLLGTSLNNTWSDFSKLTADQMNEIRTHLPDVWSEMINEGKYGDRFKEDWENYADQAGQLQEMTDELRENLAQVSFDSLRDSFVDALMDMDTKAEDFAKDFEEYMTRALLNFAVGDKMDENLQNWYNSWADTMNAQNGKLTEKQIEDYRSQWDAFVQEGLKTRDEIAELTGYTGSSSSSSQNSTKGMSQSMDQDTGNELNGRFTALQIAGEEIKNQNILQSQSLNILTMKSDAILTVNTEIKNIADETRTILANSYLELQDIRENTGAIVKPIIQMQKDMEEVKKNTSKL